MEPLAVVRKRKRGGDQMFMMNPGCGDYSTPMPNGMHQGMLSGVCGGPPLQLPPPIPPGGLGRMDMAGMGLPVNMAMSQLPPPVPQMAALAAGGKVNGAAIRPQLYRGGSGRFCAKCGAPRLDVRFTCCNAGYHARCIFPWPAAMCPTCSKPNAAVTVVPVEPLVRNGETLPVPPGPPKMRGGRWCDAEVKYAEAVIDGFNSGMLPISENMRLGSLLSNLLQCTPARLSSKLRTGKKNFRYLRGPVGPQQVFQYEQQQRKLSEQEELFLHYVPSEEAAAASAAFQLEWRLQFIGQAKRLGQRIENLHEWAAVLAERKEIMEEGEGEEDEEDDEASRRKRRGNSDASSSSQASRATQRVPRGAAGAVKPPVQAATIGAIMCTLTHLSADKRQHFTVQEGVAAARTFDDVLGQLRSASDSSTSILARASNWSILFASSGLKRILGRDDGDLLGTPLAHPAHGLVHPDDAASLDLACGQSRRDLAALLDRLGNPRGPISERDLSLVPVSLQLRRRDGAFVERYFSVFATDMFVLLHAGYAGDTPFLQGAQGQGQGQGQGMSPPRASLAPRVESLQSLPRSGSTNTTCHSDSSGSLVDRAAGPRGPVYPGRGSGGPVAAAVVTMQRLPGDLCAFSTTMAGAQGGFLAPPAVARQGSSGMGRPAAQGQQPGQQQQQPGQQQQQQQQPPPQQQQRFAPAMPSGATGGGQHASPWGQASAYTNGGGAAEGQGVEEVARKVEPVDPLDAMGKVQVEELNDDDWQEALSWSADEDEVPRPAVLTGGEVAAFDDACGGAYDLCYAPPTSFEITMRNFLIGLPFEAVDIWVPVRNPGGGFSLQFGGGVAIRPDLHQWIFYSRNFEFMSGQGMPGRVFKFMTPEFQTDVARLDQTLFLRREGAEKAGVHATFGLPIGQNESTFVLVFYSCQSSAVTQEVLEFIRSSTSSWRISATVSENERGSGSDTSSPELNSQVISPGMFSSWGPPFPLLPPPPGSQQYAQPATAPPPLLQHALPPPPSRDGPPYEMPGAGFYQA